LPREARRALEHSNEADIDAEEVEGSGHGR
jgi:hypothetical protein